MCGLMVEPKRMQRGNKSAPLSIGDGNRFLPHGARKRVAQWMSQLQANTVSISRDERATQRVKEGEHGASSALWCN
jgi:hypothetical protein